MKEPYQMLTLFQHHRNTVSSPENLPRGSTKLIQLLPAWLGTHLHGIWCSYAKAPCLKLLAPVCSLFLHLRGLVDGGYMWLIYADYSVLLHQLGPKRLLPQVSNSTQLNSNRFSVASYIHRRKLCHEDNSKQQRGLINLALTRGYIVYQLDCDNVNEKNITKMQVRVKWI